MQKNIAIGGVLVIAAFAAGVWLVWFRGGGPTIPNACTKDAKVCPDGTVVGRVAPTCQFAPCPERAFQETELRYRLITYFGKPFFCDPDFYPIAREDEEVSAARHFPEIRAKAEVFGAILAHLGIPAKETYSREEQLRIWREYKLLQAISFTPGMEEANGSYGFGIRIADAGMHEGELVTGVIERNGSISIRGRERASLVCPICLAGTTRIDTPTGAREVRDIRVGDMVTGVDPTGIRMDRRVIRTGKTAVLHHHVVELLLADGRELFVSSGHPLADGRLIGNVEVGDALDGSIVRMTRLIPYEEPFTYDILLDGGAAYIANGIPLRSTLEP